MASKHYTTQYNKCSRVESAIYDVYSSCRIFQPCFNDFLGLKKKRIHEHPDLKGLTSYNIGYLIGIESCLFHTLQKEWVEWMMYYTNKNGKVIHVRKWQRLPKYIKDNGNFNGNFFWKRNERGKARRLPRVFKPFGNNPSNGVGRKREK